MPLSRRSRETWTEVPGSLLDYARWSNPPHSCESPVERLRRKQDPIAVRGSQVTDSEGHPGWRQRKETGVLKDIGGDFFTRKEYVTTSGMRMSGEWEDFWSLSCKEGYKFSGSLYATSPHGTGSYPTVTSSSSPAEIDNLGATAVSRAKPTNPNVDLSQTLGEMRFGGLPRANISSWESIVKTARESGVHNLSREQLAVLARQGGDDYLSYEFGYKPLVSDILNFADGVSRAAQILRQYERDAGKVVRRRYEFPLERSSSISDISEASGAAFVGGAYTIPSQLVASTLGQRISFTERWKRKWFSGAFTYHLPVGYSSRSTLDRIDMEAKRVLGLELTPDTIWNLSPWSWAVDWFSTIGDVISNATDAATDGLILRYGYVMEHTIDKCTVSRTGYRLKGGSGGLADVSFVRETKIRRKANPFGFGITWSGLTPRQLAIAAALGITRG